MASMVGFGGGREGEGREGKERGGMGSLPTFNDTSFHCCSSIIDINVFLFEPKHLHESQE